MRVVLVFLLAAGVWACGDDDAPQPSTADDITQGDGREEAQHEPAEPAERLEYSIAIHGGAGAPPRDLDPDRRRAYVESLASALRQGCDGLRQGDSSLDVVERVIRSMEDDPLFNAGRGAVFTREGTHELDASIMDGRDLSCGAVAAVTTVEHPITLARAVMTRTRHVLLAGDGAEAFAREMGMDPVPNEHFSTDSRRESLERVLEADEKGTVGVVALDREGDLAAGTSTGGLTGKRWGRIGDSPIVGAGTYADNRTCAVSCTGTGEEFIRHGIAQSVSARMALAGETVQQAADHVVRQTLREGDGGLIAVSHRGEIALAYNTGGMFRGKCAADGTFEVAIWEDPEELPQGLSGPAAPGE